ncbi:MAG: cytochrome-c oxidase, cbb3-type subunit III [Wenzhouxiangellaceae bacterium]|nr:cytochrome-c oxidase, cbb3-type subunit III [Wenzhouxiangellaceae bacterium]MBS3822473.1 cytochrome-c oxidase, cbb3-type subunit III [Wenzhouxiangellaceae bacterium]
MSNFWHWYIIIITVGTLVATIWFLLWTSRLRIPSTKEEDGSETTGHVWDEDLRELNNPLPRWWLGLFWITIVFSILYLVLYPGLGRYEGVLGWSQSEQYEQEMAQARAAFEQRFGHFDDLSLSELADDPQAVQMGRNLYAHNCSTCHGSDARGARGYPNLTDDHWIWGGNPSQIEHSVVQGRQAAMPPWGDALGEDGVTRTAVYVQKLAGKPVDETMATAGRQNYMQFCASCHGAEGKGNPALGAPDLTTGVYTYGGDLDTLRATIRNGRNGVMPAQNDLIGETRARLAAAYILSLKENGSGTGAQAAE